MRRLGVVLPLLCILGCGREKEPGGRLEMGWTGADSGRLESPATAQWCARDTVLEISGILADSGVAVAIFPADTILAPGVYPVGAPEQDMARPRARVALRRFGENLILGYYSLSGTVTVDSAPPLHGTLQATLKGVNTGDQVNATGTFSGLVVEPGGMTCRAARGTAVDTGLF